MALETAFDTIDDLNPSWPLDGDLIEEGDNHIRGTKSAIKGSFPNLGSTPVERTAEELNAVLTTAGGGVTGTVTFNDENSGFEWDLSGSSPAWAQKVSFTAFSVGDPYVAGNPTVAGLSLNAPIVQVNNPVLPGVTSGFQIYCSSADAAPVCGFEFLDSETASPNNKLGGLSVYQNAGGNTDLVFRAFDGQCYFQDIVANGGNILSLSQLVGAQQAVQAVQDAHGPLLAYIEALEARIAALEAA
jgi:hypothetical protein